MNKKFTNKYSFSKFSFLHIGNKTTINRSNTTQQGSTVTQSTSESITQAGGESLHLANNFPSEVINVDGTKFVMGKDSLPDSDNYSQLQKRHLIDYEAAQQAAANTTTTTSSAKSKK